MSPAFLFFTTICCILISVDFLFVFMKRKPKIILVRDKMQTGYRYELVEPEGRNFDPEFRPELTPKQMLELGVFGGRYLRDCKKEFPAAWFKRAKLLPPDLPGHDPKLNFFGVDASQPLKVWQKNDWIHPQDPRGWFQWYCRYYLGRRSEDDQRQIKRWLNMKRHISQLKKYCRKKDLNCRRGQRQALLHWAYDSRKI